MRNFIPILIFLLLVPKSVLGNNKVMNNEESQKTWDDYHERINNRRLAEVKIMNAQLKAAGIDSENDLVLDFIFFATGSDALEGAEGIKKQLSENYEMTINKEKDHIAIKGTTRPNVVNFDHEQHLGWVQFMHDVALSYGCIFSSWSIYDPVSKNIWSNENIETEFD